MTDSSNISDAMLTAGTDVILREVGGAELGSLFDVRQLAGRVYLAMRQRQRSSKPSRAQATYLMACLSGPPDVARIHDDIGGYTPPTTIACIRRGWLAQTDKTGRFPNGQPYRVYHVTSAGKRALAAYLMADAE